MANFSDVKCLGCTYKDQMQLEGTSYYVSRSNIPVSIDKGLNSNMLIVLQAPGEEEWKKGRPLQAIKKVGGTAGRRIELSWKRVGKKRTEFDITSSVQCFPGKKADGRDLEPSDISIECCFQWLKEDIKNGNYTKIIGFGDIAIQQIYKVVSELHLNVQVIECKHPNGGVKNLDLDSMW
jgi:uracil-DNA glycosylase family 4